MLRVESYTTDRTNKEKITYIHVFKRTKTQYEYINQRVLNPTNMNSTLCTYTAHNTYNNKQGANKH